MRRAGTFAAVAITAGVLGGVASLGCAARRDKAASQATYQALLSHTIMTVSEYRRLNTDKSLPLDPIEFHIWVLQNDPGRLPLFDDATNVVLDTQDHYGKFKHATTGLRDLDLAAAWFTWFGVVRGDASSEELAARVAAHIDGATQSSKSSPCAVSCTVMRVANGTCSGNYTFYYTANAGQTSSAPLSANETPQSCQLLTEISCLQSAGNGNSACNEWSALAYGGGGRLTAKTDISMSNVTFDGTKSADISLESNWALNVTITNDDGCAISGASRGLGPGTPINTPLSHNLSLSSDDSAPPGDRSPSLGSGLSTGSVSVDTAGVPTSLGSDATDGPSTSGIYGQGEDGTAEIFDSVAFQVPAAFTFNPQCENQSYSVWWTSGASALVERNCANGARWKGCSFNATVSSQLNTRLYGAATSCSAKSSGGGAVSCSIVNAQPPPAGIGGSPPQGPFACSSPTGGAVAQGQPCDPDGTGDPNSTPGTTNAQDGNLIGQCLPDASGTLMCRVVLTPCQANACGCSN